MLTRRCLTSGSFDASLATVPAALRWSACDIDASLRDTLAQAIPEDEASDANGIWLFAYGSLIWNPLLRHSGCVKARLPGWHRRFCQTLVGGRASQQAPGRMLALCDGGETDGLVYRIDGHERDNELKLVWLREMAMGAYRPIWADVTLDDGRQVRALVFVADQDHPLYETDCDADTVAPLIANARGPWGSNAEYVMQLRDALSALRIADGYIDTIAQAVTNVAGKLGRSAIDAAVSSGLPMRRAA